jgi:pimeloyl-ACP methyl ester carboxylesterase
MGTITVKDGTTIYYKDWGAGPAVTFSHGWPLNSDAWTARCCFSRSTAIAVSPWIGVDMVDPVSRP